MVDLALMDVLLVNRGLLWIRGSSVFRRLCLSVCFPLLYCTRLKKISYTCIKNNEFIFSTKILLPGLGPGLVIL